MTRGLPGIVALGLCSCLWGPSELALIDEEAAEQLLARDLLRPPPGLIVAGPCAGYRDNEVLQGDRLVDTWSDLVGVLDRRCITGSLHLRALPAVEGLDRLERLGGDLHVVANPTLSALRLPELVDIGGVLAIAANPALARVELPVLGVVGDHHRRPLGRLRIVNNPALVQLSLPALEVVEADLWITDNAALGELVAPQLVEVDGCLGIARNAALWSVQLPRLALVGGCGEGWQGFAGLTVAGNPALEAVLLPALTTLLTDLAIRDNPRLVRLELSALTLIGDKLAVHDNPSLPTCAVQALRQQVELAQGIGGGVQGTGNDDPCSPDPCAGAGCVVDCDQPGGFVCRAGRR